MPADINQWRTRASDSECTGDLNTLDAEQKLSCRIATCIESMEHVTFANPAQESCDDVKGCIMLTGDECSTSTYFSILLALCLMLNCLMSGFGE